MIRLHRDRTAAVIPSSFRGQTPKDRLFESMTKVRQLMIAGQPVKLKFESKWSVTKDQLLKETHDKCAYCETPTKVVAFGDVEHYRPKSVYWWLAYVYDNYLASCAVCNQSFKSDQFEFAGVAMAAPVFSSVATDPQLKTLAGTAVPDPMDAAAVARFEALHAQEQPLIPNPYFDDPAAVFAWKADNILREVSLVAISGNAFSIRTIDAVERIYGLNRPELKRLRYSLYRMYKMARQTAENTAVPQDVRDGWRDLIATMVLPEAQYAGMIQYFEAQPVLV